MDEGAGYYFAGTVAACSLNALALILACKHSSRGGSTSESYEAKFAAFKHGRMAVYAVVAATQLTLLCWRAASHWPVLTWIDASQAAVLLLYAATLAVLCARWPHQLSLKLSAVLLLALLEPSILFAQDVTFVHPGGVFDAEHVARVVVHGVQLVLLVALLISEVIIQQHQLLQRSSFGGSSDVAAASGTPQQQQHNQFKYQRLPGGQGDVEHGSSDGSGGLRGSRRGGSRKPYKLWRPGDSRWQMGASAFSYVWPTDGMLRVRLAACFVLVIAERAINLAAPIAFKHMVESLSNVRSAAAATLAAAAGGAGAATGNVFSLSLRQLLEAAASAAGSASAGAGAVSAVAASAAGAGAGVGPGAAGAAVLGGDGGDLLAPFWVLFYPWVFVYLGAFLLRGGSGSEGLLANVRDVLWIPITQAAFRHISNDVFGHLLALDLNWHVHRKTGQIMRILDRGTSSIQDTVSIVLFNVLPQMVDIVVACSYLASRMEPWVALIVLVTVSSYVPLTVCITERRGKVRKVMNALDNERESRATDMLLNYETVKYCCNEHYELAGYDRATRQYQAAEYWQMAFLSLLSLVQSWVVWVGLAAGLVVCVWGSSRGRLTVGDTVLFITMMQQLYVPLTYFGSYYRQVTKALIDMENMFELLATEPAVQDEEGAATLRVTEGRVEFKQVVFSYTLGLGAPVLRGLSFSCPGGSTLAVVGSTGSGKSTLLRLLLRFYDPQSGAVLIDSQDIRHCSQGSVRSAIAVVPQDTVLFNDTLMYNIRYGRPGASDSQVYEAAEIGHIHQHIMHFPHGYSTRVGERGLRLSGGEKQRVAFARAILKGPAILVLDEATSALDSLTERLIQDSLATIRGRYTQLIVAHRLSTVMDADQILVLERGQVAEVGTHQELIEAGGLYCSMWARQQDPYSSATPATPSPDPAADANGGSTAAAAAAAGAGSTGDGRGSGEGRVDCSEVQAAAAAGDEARDGADDEIAGTNSSGCGGRFRSGLMQSGRSIRRYQQLKRSGTATSDIEYISEAPSPEDLDEGEQQQAAGAAAADERRNGISSNSSSSNRAGNQQYGSSSTDQQQQPRGLSNQ